MAAQMFAEVNHKATTRLRYSMPMAVGIILIAILSVYVGPLLAETKLPVPHHDVMLLLATAKAPPVEPLVPHPPIGPDVPPVYPPTEAPHVFTEEKPSQSPIYRGPIEGPIRFGPTTTTFATPPEVAKPESPIRISGDIREPQKIRDVKPIYPKMAIDTKTEGMVIIEATISKDGRVIDAKILRHQPLLDQAALDAVSQWLYKPTTLSGTPVDVIMTVTVNFTLH